MDINQALKDYLFAIEQGDFSAQEDILRDMRQWIRRGGFLPDYLRVMAEFTAEMKAKREREED